MLKKDIDTLLKNMVIIIDTREKVNSHITDYFDKMNICYVSRTLKYGDYSAFIRYNKETSHLLDDVFSFENNVVIERKNSINELVGNFKHRERFFNEFEKAKKNNCKIMLQVEELEGLNNIIYGKYRSEFNPKALYASLKTLESMFNFQTKFVDKKISGLEIYYTLYYEIKSLLKKGVINREKS